MDLEMYLESKRLYYAQKPIIEVQETFLPTKEHPGGIARIVYRRAAQLFKPPCLPSQEDRYVREILQEPMKAEIADECYRWVVSIIKGKEYPIEIKNFSYEQHLEKLQWCDEVLYRLEIAYPFGVKVKQEIELDGIKLPAAKIVKGE